MKTKIKKTSLTSFLCIFAFVVLIAVAWTTVASNAFAIDDEVVAADSSLETNDAENALPEITYVVDPDLEVLKNCCTRSDYPYGGSATEYSCTVISQKNSMQLQLRVPDSSTPVITLRVSITEAESAGYDVDGFYIGDTRITSETVISSNTQITVKFTKIKPILNITIRKAESPSTFVEDYNIDLYDKNHSLKNTYRTDQSGKCSIEITDDLYGSYIFGWKEGLTDFAFGIDKSMFAKNPRYNRGCFVFDRDSANQVLTCDNENHLFFKIYEEQNDPWGGTISFSSFCKEFWFFVYSPAAPISLKFTINQDGSILETVIDREGSFKTYTPISKNGAQVDHWIAKYNNSNDTTRELYPGDYVDINFTTGNIFLEPVYKDIPTPPEPTPTPAEDINATPLTGDNSPLVPFMLLAVLAGGVLLYTRKIAQK